MSRSFRRPRLALRISALPFAVLASACDMSLDPEEVGLREVAWRIDAIEGRPHEFGLYSVRLPDYQIHSLDSPLVCRPTLHLMPIGRWGWVEDLLDRYVGPLAETDGARTNLWDVAIQVYCGQQPPFTVTGRLNVDVGVSRGADRVEMRSAVLKGHLGSHGPSTDEEIARWLRVSLGSAPLGDVVRLPLDVHITIWENGPGSRVAWSGSRTLQVDYRRWERLLERYP